MSDNVYLKETEEGLILTDDTLSYMGDLSEMSKRVMSGKLAHEMLAKAARLKISGSAHTHPIAIDATAGMGEDSVILAAAGYEVYMFESNETIAALLEDAHKRALAKYSELEDTTASESFYQILTRMHIIKADSICAMQMLSEAINSSESNTIYNIPVTNPDLIYLDPMFPERQKSGLIKKKFQLLQQLERPCDNGDELFNAALSLHPTKIIVKRPAKGPFLTGKKPSYSHEGKAIRYDCYINLG